MHPVPEASLSQHAPPAVSDRLVGALGVGSRRAERTWFRQRSARRSWAGSEAVMARLLRGILGRKPPWSQRPGPRASISPAPGIL